MKLRGAWLIVATALLSGSANAQTFKREELRIPAPGTGKRGLEALLVRPDLPGRLPLVVISHGSPVKTEDRRNVTALLHLPQAIEFARRGWAAAVVIRRGFGSSGGNYNGSPGACEHPNYAASGTAATLDLKASVAHLRERADIDSSRLLAIGQSTGGFATVALTADPPPGLLAAINFAGGQISTRAGEPCKDAESHLVEAFKRLGKRSRTPMLWIYSENDQLFPPKLARQFKDAFSDSGGRVDFIKAAPFRDNGHSLFARGIPQWASYVDEFLKQQGLVMIEKPLPVPQPIPPPPQLSANGRKVFEDFLYAAPHRALAISPTRGAIGWQGGARTAEQAKKAALERCGKHVSDCRIVVVNDEAVP